MTFIIGDKIYDTNTSEKVIEYSKSYPMTLITGHEYYLKKETTLYRTKKGNWFSVSKEDFGRYKAYRENELSAKEILKQLNTIDIYNKYFGQLELA